MLEPEVTSTSQQSNDTSKEKGQNLQCPSDLLNKKILNKKKSMVDRVLSNQDQ